MFEDNVWVKVPTETGLTVAPKYETFIERDNQGRKTGRVKYVYPNYDAASSTDYSYVVECEPY